MHPLDQEFAAIHRGYFQDPATGQCSCGGRWRDWTLSQDIDIESSKYQRQLTGLTGDYIEHKTMLYRLFVLDDEADCGHNLAVPSAGRQRLASWRIVAF